jgi:nucleotide-binding universal stress UspA family protein
MYSRIVVPLDGSEVAEEALAHAVEFAKLLNTPLHLVRVADAHALESVAGTGMGFDYVEMGTLLQDEIDAARSYIDAKTEELSGNGQSVSNSVVTGPVSRSIVDQLKTGDLLVIASHGRTGISRWFLGSVAEDVIRHSPVPVLLIRHGAGESKPGTGTV